MHLGKLFVSVVLGAKYVSQIVHEKSLYPGQDIWSISETDSWMTLKFAVDILRPHHPPAVTKICT